MNLAKKEAKYRLGELYNQKVQANFDLLFCTKDQSKNLRYHFRGDVNFLHITTKEHFCIPLAAEDRASSDNGYIFSYARSNGDTKVGLLHDHWIYDKNIRIEHEYRLIKEHNMPARYIRAIKGDLAKFNLSKGEIMKDYFDWAEQYPDSPQLLDIKNLNMKTVKDALIKKVNFADKKPVIYWRGARTGNFCDFQKRQGYTHKAVERKKIINYFNSNPSNYIDISFTGQPKDRNFTVCEDRLAKTQIDTKRYADMGHKYLVELQGNDYASNAYWIYSKDCVVFRPDFLKSYSAWDCHLEPWVHYVPFDHANYGDLVDKIKWCEKNTGKCEKIIKNANELHQLMLDEKHRTKVYMIMYKKIKKNLIVQ